MPDPPPEPPGLNIFPPPPPPMDPFLTQPYTIGKVVEVVPPFDQFEPPPTPFGVPPPPPPAKYTEELTT